MNIALEDMDALMRLGYTAEEARFIYIVAIHSGYFTHQQFLQFSETKPGKHSQKFLEKLLASKHASFQTYQSGARVYHVFSRKIFKAIDRDNLRTRRKHQLDHVKSRLMALDFVLSNLEHQYLETEAEKVPYFETKLNVKRGLLPSRTYSSKVSPQQTIRYFVDRFPIYVSDTSSAIPLVTLTYMDPGFATVQGFSTHIQAYRGLLRSLPRFELVYVSDTERPFATARAEFARAFSANAHGTKADLIRYFDLRKAWQARQRVSAGDVVFLNATKKRFHGQTVESLYQKWCRGIADEAQFKEALGVPETAVGGTLTTLRGGDSLTIFKRPSQECVNPDAKMHDGTFSPGLSPEISPL